MQILPLKEKINKLMSLVDMTYQATFALMPRLGRS